MLTYVSPAERFAEPLVLKEKPWLLLVLCLFWLLPGLVGHDPWKPLENQSVAVIQALLAGSDWSQLTLAGASYLEHAPLYYWCAALLGKVLSVFGVSLHDAARLTSGLWMGLAMWGVGLAGLELHGRRFGRVAVVALIGSIGLLQWGHHISPAVVGLAAFTWQLYALALARRFPLTAGALLGVAWLVLLLGASWSEASLVMSCALILGVFPAWRNSGYLVALLAAFTIAVPLGLLWPLSLYRHAPEVFDVWWHNHSFGLYGGVTNLRFFHKPGYLLSIVIWFAFPVLPLAAWSLWLHRRSLFDSRWLLLILQCGGVALWLLCSGEPSEAHALLLLAPLSLLAAAGVDELRRSAASSLFWFGSLTFGVLALVLWGGWLALWLGWPDSVVVWLQRHNTAVTPAVGWGILFAVAISLIWGRVLFRNRPFGRRAVTIWACGLTLVWGLLVSLWQPWLDISKSYRVVGESLRTAASANPGCVALLNSGLEQRGGLAYFSGLDLRIPEAKGSELCSWVLVLDRAKVDDKMMLIWTGGRPGEKDEHFSLYRKLPNK